MKVVLPIFFSIMKILVLFTRLKSDSGPHFDQIKSNWEKLQASTEQLLWILTNDQKKEAHFASISVWKQSNYGLIAQHLVSDGNPVLSLKVMLAAQFKAEHHFDKNEIRSSQNWFRPDNRYAFRIFASMFDKLGSEKASLIRFEYLYLPIKFIEEPKQYEYQVDEVTGIDHNCVSFIQKQYGNVFVKAEELDQNDIQLKKVATEFRKCGLNRSRKVFKVKNHRTQQTIACIVANRGPIGLNFSFFENRAYYIIDKTLTNEERNELIPVMNTAIKTYYADFEFQKIPIATDELSSEVLKSQGAVFFKTYMQSIWLREGFAQWYKHINSFLKRIDRKANNKKAA